MTRERPDLTAYWDRREKQSALNARFEANRARQQAIDDAKKLIEQLHEHERERPKREAEEREYQVRQYERNQESVADEIYTVEQARLKGWDTE